MNRNTFTPNTAPTEGPYRLQYLIRAWIACNPEGFASTEEMQPEAKRIQLRPRSLSVLRPACCSPSTALSWISEITGSALAGDDNAQRLLPSAIQHYLASVRQDHPKRIQLDPWSLS